MNASTKPNLQSFSRWIQSVDHHAAYHLKLMERADQFLSGEIYGSDDSHIELSGKLERWRYQYLNERDSIRTAQDAIFLESLDLASNSLARRSPRRTRWTFDAIRATSTESRQVEEASDLLKSGIPLRDLVQQATELTKRYFAVDAPSTVSSPTPRRMLLYAPLYVSNHCVNHCTYCGFRHSLDIVRRHLTVEETLVEARVLRDRGFRQIVVVAGDFPSRTTTEYFCDLLDPLVGMGFCPTIEIAPQSTSAYARLAAAGATALTLYQETYDEALYRKYHARGPKASYAWRLEGPDRAAEAGIQRLGLGILLGLGPPESDLLALIRHGHYLMQQFPDCTLAFSLPRIHEAPPGFTKPFAVPDEQLIRHYCLLRAAFPTAELVLSTRETASLRNRLAEICITQLSAGSCTSPGGYQNIDHESSRQFPVADERSSAEVANWLQAHQFQAVWSVS